MRTATQCEDAVLEVFTTKHSVCHWYFWKYFLSVWELDLIACLSARWPRSGGPRLHRTLQPQEHHRQVQEPRPALHWQRVCPCARLLQEAEQAGGGGQGQGGQGAGQGAPPGQEGRQEGDDRRPDGHRPRGRQPQRQGGVRQHQEHPGNWWVSKLCYLSLWSLRQEIKIVKTQTGNEKIIHFMGKVPDLVLIPDGRQGPTIINVNSPNSQTQSDSLWWFSQNVVWLKLTADPFKYANLSFIIVKKYFYSKLDF